MFRTITLKTKGKAKEKPKDTCNPQEPKKGESWSLPHKNQRKERASPSLPQEPKKRES
jgi:hypothetical protein